MNEYIKRLQTVQNMAENVGVKELCEVMMDYLESQDKKKVGFKTDEDSTNS